MPDSSPQDMLGMSDEEFLNLNSPPASAGEGASGDDSSASQQADTQQQADDTQAQAADATDTQAAASQDDDDDQANDQQQGNDSATQVADSSQKVDDKSQQDATLAQDKSGEGDKADGQDADPKTEAAAPLDYEGLYKKLMAPLKANGKTIEIQSPEEAIQLMQMGANYTRKMQSIAPHRKVLLMLENNGLLDEGKLSFLIDLDKKNPDAIKKLIKESGIDPLQIDTDEQNPTYHLGNHQVTDEEATFATVLEDVKSSPAGVNTLQAIINEWDQASKEVLWKNPELMTTIHEQRQSGIYQMITAEMERLRILGSLPAHVPFINAYKAVGDQLNASGKFGSPPQQQPGQQSPQPVATRVATPKPVVANGDKANAAAPSRSSTKKAAPFVNPLAMSDEEFAKQFSNRL